jgi:gluconokinase
MSSVPLAAAQPPFILVIDIGTSSLRAMLFDGQARDVVGMRARQAYSARVGEDGASELDPAAMFTAFALALDELCANLPAGIKIAGAATSSLATNMLAVDSDAHALTPAYLYSDTRDAAAVEELRARYDWEPFYERTGCPLHTSYLPARFVWLRETQPELFERAVQWVSLHEFFLLQLFGRAIVSHSFASWSGLFNRMWMDWDEELLDIVGVRREQLSPVHSAKDCVRNLKANFAARWRLLADVPFFPAIGDGAVANVGSGCIDAMRVAITIGTSGAMRAVIPEQEKMLQIPHGLWLYNVDEHRGLLGGSLNNGGNVFAYWQNTLRLPDANVLEHQLEAMPPDSHGLTVLPFFAGERSPGYHGNARAAINGLSLDCTPVQIVRASLEAVAYRLALIYDLLREAIRSPREIIASGSALLHSPAWVQIIAEVLGQPVIVSGEEEASARGAAVLALEAIGAIRDAREVEADRGATFTPNPAHREIYQRGLHRHQRLYEKLIEG